MESSTQVRLILTLRYIVAYMKTHFKGFRHFFRLISVSSILVSLSIFAILKWWQPGNYGAIPESVLELYRSIQRCTFSYLRLDQFIQWMLTNIDVVLPFQLSIVDHWRDLVVLLFLYLTVHVWDVIYERPSFEDWKTGGPTFAKRLLGVFVSIAKLIRPFKDPNPPTSGESNARSPSKVRGVMIRALGAIIGILLSLVLAAALFAQDLPAAFVTISSSFVGVMLYRVLFSIQMGRDIATSFFSIKFCRETWKKLSDTRHLFYGAIGFLVVAYFVGTAVDRSYAGYLELILFKGALIYLATFHLLLKFNAMPLGEIQLLTRGTSLPDRIEQADIERRRWEFETSGIFRIGIEILNRVLGTIIYFVTVWLVLDCTP